MIYCIINSQYHMVRFILFIYILYSIWFIILHYAILSSRLFQLILYWSDFFFLYSLNSTLLHWGHRISPIAFTSLLFSPFLFFSLPITSRISSLHFSPLLFSSHLTSPLSSRFPSPPLLSLLFPLFSSSPLSPPLLSSPLLSSCLPPT